ETARKLKGTEIQSLSYLRRDGKTMRRVPVREQRRRGLHQLICMNDGLFAHFAVGRRAMCSDCCRAEDFVDGGMTIVQETLIEVRCNGKGKRNAPKIGSIGEALKSRHGLSIDALKINFRASTDETWNAFADQCHQNPIAVPTRF